MTDVAPLLTYDNMRGRSPQDVRIVKAAIRHGEQVYTGWRHSEIIQHLNRLDILTAQEDQGFIDQYGVFYGRYQAARIALHAKQIARLTPLLTSEDLWDNDGTPREVGEPYNPAGGLEEAGDRGQGARSAARH